MLQIIFYLIIVSPFPIYFLLKYFIENLATNSPLEVILPNVFIIIVWIEIIVLYFAFNFLFIFLILVFLAMVVQSYLTWMQFAKVSKVKKDEAFNLLLKLKDYSLYSYVILILLSFIIHVVWEMFF